MTLTTELLPHQAAAVEKLRGLRIGALYMEMGTGKTRTTLELIRLRLDAGKLERIIWLCPCSVKENLRQDIRKHSDLLDSGLLTICGIETLSTSVQWCSDLMSIAQQHRTMLIVDESTLVKNPFALRTVHISSIGEACPYRLILNGTPITRCEADLFSQWYLLDWRILGYRSYYSFAANHLEYDDKGRIRRVLNTDYLAAKIGPYTYQCLKAEVMKLPEKRIEMRHFWMSPEQGEEYEITIDTLLTSLDEMSSEAIYQLFGALQSIVSGYTLTIAKARRGHHITRKMRYDDPRENPRVQELLDVVDAIQGDKAIIFCTYTDEIETLLKVLPGAVPFYGAESLKARERSIEMFRGPAQFLVANKACGAFGLNLQFCHRIIYYSHDWNWGTRAQSEDRVHRFGQTEDVLITEIAASGTIDESILRCLARKENLSDRFKGEIDRQTVEDFVRGGKKIRGKSIPADLRMGSDAAAAEIPV